MSKFKLYDLELWKPKTTDDINLFTYIHDSFNRLHIKTIDNYIGYFNEKNIIVYEFDLINQIFYSRYHLYYYLKCYEYTDEQINKNLKYLFTKHLNPPFKITKFVPFNINRNYHSKYNISQI